MACAILDEADAAPKIAEKTSLLDKISLAILIAYDQGRADAANIINYGLLREKAKRERRNRP